MKITNIDRPACRLIHEAVDAKLKEALAEFGLEIQPTKASFSPTEIHLRAVIFVPQTDKGGRVLTPEAKIFQQDAQLFGLKPTDLWRKLSFQGDEYEIIGMKARGQKYPILCKRLSNGKVFKFNEDTVKRCLK